MNCTVCPSSGADRQRAHRIATELGLSCVNRLTEVTTPVALVVDVERSWLQRVSEPILGPVSVDFASSAMLYRRRAGHNEPIGRAVGVKADRFPTVFDATAGLGRDAFVLADLGCQITLCEQLAPVAHLLAEAVSIAKLSTVQKVQMAAERMTVTCADSTGLDASGYDVIYLDPMFPERSKTAAVKKDLATLQALRHDSDQDTDATALLTWAKQQSVSRIVVKRPVKADVVGKVKPSHSIVGKTVRYDVFVQ